MDQAKGRRKRRGVSDRGLKIVGLALLLTSMVSTGVVLKDMPPDLEQLGFARLTVAMVLEALSWAAIPIYAWLVCTGFAHTRSAPRYALRLAGLAVIAEVPYDLATSGALWDMSSQNPVFAVLTSLLVLMLGQSATRSQALSRAARGGLWAALAIAGALWLTLFNIGLRLGVLPTGVLVLAFTLLFQLLAKRQNTMMFAGALIGVLGGITTAFGFVFLHFRNDRLGMDRGRDKYIFYALYPLCLAAAAVYRTWPA
ncbi:MAG: conjugal transfer protein TraX [Bifidobacteriaceae bacterium]|jgi:hypothetical protein|nr:conjugal transfer protein TraX [Bifidobacteriaceae bacterium]